MRKVTGIVVLFLGLFQASCGVNRSGLEDVTLTECSGDPAYTQARLAIENGGNANADYQVIVSFTNKASGNQLATGSGEARALAAAQRTSIVVNSPQWFFNVEEVECTIADVQRVAR